MRLVKFFAIFSMLVLALSQGFGQTQRKDNTASEHNFNVEQVSVFPNPSIGDDYVHVRTEHLESSNITLAIHNIIGNEMPIEIEVVDEHELRIRVKDLAAGYYFLAVKDRQSNFQRAFKILKR